jgi:hypothetical protein
VRRHRIARGTALALAATAAGLLVASCRPAASASANDASCPPGASAEKSGCTCRADLHLVLGACVSPRIAADFCGTTAKAGARGCLALPPCEPGRARDVASGECLPRREVRALASSTGILVGDDEIVKCQAGEQLAAIPGDASAGGLRLACFAPRRMAATTCPAGSIASRAAGPARCARVTTGSRLDVARWLQAVVGPDGGEATPLLCEALERAGRRGASGARVTVALAFPDNDVTLVAASITSEGATAELASAAEHATAPMIEALRSLGGTASQASASTTVRCAAGPSAASRPVAGPENDDEK